MDSRALMYLRLSDLVFNQLDTQSNKVVASHVQSCLVKMISQ